MQRARLAILLFFLAGCGDLILAGSGDLETDHLPAGATAILVDHDRNNGVKNEQVMVKGVDRRNSAPASFLDQGTHVTIVADDDDPSDSTGNRDVTVRIENGPFQGETGQVVRQAIALANVHQPSP